MHIMINGSLFRELRDSLLPDIVQILGEASFPFKLDQAQNTLLLAHPIEGHQVILECEDSALRQSLIAKASEMLRECGFHVHLIQRAEERSAVISSVNVEKPVLWLKLQRSTSTEWSAQFSFQQMKWSKSLAHRLISQLSRCSDLEVQGVQLNWKNMIGSIITKTDHPFAGVTLTCGSLEGLSSFQQGLLAQGIVKAMTSLYTDKPILEVIRALRSMAYEPGVHLQTKQEGVAVTTPRPEQAADVQKVSLVSSRPSVTIEAKEPNQEQQAIEAAFSIEETPIEAGLPTKDTAPLGSDEQQAEAEKVDNTAELKPKLKRMARLHRSYESAAAISGLSTSELEGIDESSIGKREEIDVEQPYAQDQAPNVQLPNKAVNNPAPSPTGSIDSVQVHVASIAEEDHSSDQEDTSLQQELQKEEEQKMKKPTSYSTFLLLKATHQGEEGSDSPSAERQRGHSFMSYMNHMAASQQPERKKQEVSSFNLLTTKQQNKS